MSANAGTATTVAPTATDPQGRHWLWRSNGSARGTRHIKRLFKSDMFDEETQVLRATLFFKAVDGHGLELWRTDGTPRGTVRATDMNPGPASSSPSGLLAVDDRLFLAATDKAHWTDLWSLTDQQPTLR